MRSMMRAVLAATLLATQALALAACSPTPDVASPPSPGASTPEPEARPPRSPVPPERVPISETPCRQAIGEAASAKLVRRCITVSPATHPPCNAANSCDLIQSEIDRSCALFRDGTKPAECAG